MEARPVGSCGCATTPACSCVPTGRAKPAREDREEAMTSSVPQVVPSVLRRLSSDEYRPLPWTDDDLRALALLADRLPANARRSALDLRAAMPANAAEPWRRCRPSMRARGSGSTTSRPTPRWTPRRPESSAEGRLRSSTSRPIWPSLGDCRRPPAKRSSSFSRSTIPSCGPTASTRSSSRPPSGSPRSSATARPPWRC